MAEAVPENPAAADPFKKWALSPGQLTDTFIEYGTKAGDSIWRDATAKLAEEPFDCTTDGLRDFLQLVKRRAQVMGWNNTILHIPVDMSDLLGASEDFFAHYGELKIEVLREHAITYATKKTRVAQESFQLYHCLYNSLSKVGRDKVSLKEAAYTIEVDGVEMQCGVLLLKVIIQESSIDTNATTSAIRMALASLDEYMPTVGDNITKFNQHVSAQVELLKARGHQTHDLTVNLFKAYGTVKDSKFREYIAQKESEYEENNEELSYEKLMQLAENKYKIRKVRHQWNAPTPEEEKIIALESYIKKMDKGNPRNKVPALKKATPKDDKKKKSPKEPKKTYEPEPWMLLPPKEGEAKEKTVEGKSWYWCPKHDKWTRHKPEDCKGLRAKPGHEKKAKAKKKANLARAVSALAEESDEE